MARTLMIGAALVLMGIGGASAQSDAPPPSTENAGQGGAGIRGGNITSTGATVPNPGVSQSGGTTDLDRGVQREDNKITSGICKGC